MSKRKRLQVVTSPSTELAALSEEWLSEQQARGLSIRSVDMGRDTLKWFLPWAAARGVSTAAQLDTDLMNALSIDLQGRTSRAGRPLSRASVRTYMRTLKAFVKWAEKRGDITGVVVPVPKQERRMMDPLSRAEINLMENAAKTERDKLIIRLLADTGMRLGELLALRPEDLIKDRDARYLRVRGKGSKERMVTVMPQLWERLNRFTKREQTDTTTSRIFVTERRDMGQFVALQQRTVQQMVAYLARTVGITRRVHPHLFRHSFATWQLNRGAGVVHLKDELGHADLSMITSVYSHVTPGDRYKAMLELARREEDEERR